MIAQAVPAQAVPARLERLERLERRYRRISVVLSAALVLLTVLAMRSSQAPVLRAERVELLAPSGVPQAVISADSGGVYLSVLDERGRPAAGIRLNREPWLSVRSGDGQEVAGLGAPKVHRLGE
ncbi:MAG TPA: hypothetical protein VEB59_04175 [Gemmatimonadales bacterium]|nr:hypothetical protein [Gemmatimonadales bacterium]